MKRIEEIEITISKFLRVGVFFAALLMLIGWCLQIQWNGNTFFTFEIYDQISLIDILKLHYYREHWAPLVSYAGLATLISLPILRVLITAVLFFRNKEYKLAGISLIVLSGLCLSIFLGIDI